MNESNPWSDQWFKAQQQFVDAWSDVAKSSQAGAASSQSDLWARNIETWRQACGGQSQPDVKQVMEKCYAMGKEYFAMGEQVGKAMASGANPVEAINQWMEQMKSSLTQLSTMPGFDSSSLGDFMKQWFTPTTSWQQLAATLTPMNQAAWQFPGMNTSVFNIGEAIDPLGKILEAPGVGYFREPQEKQQRGAQLAIEYHESNFKFNQAFLRVAIESIQGFQTRLLRMDADSAPGSLREIYDLWVEVSEEHYAEFAMSDEYQSLYGDMVNRLMILKKHYSEITDDMLRALNLPNTREVDTMQQRLQQLRRENIQLKKDVKEIKASLSASGRQSASAGKQPAPRVATKKKTVAPRAAAKKKTVAPRAAAKKKAAVRKAPLKKQAKVSKAKAGA